jgi:hypothetical protein
VQRSERGNKIAQRRRVSDSSPRTRSMSALAWGIVSWSFCHNQVDHAYFIGTEKHKALPSGSATANSRSPHV